MITRNLWTSKGVVNGAQGTVKHAYDFCGTDITGSFTRQHRLLFLKGSIPPQMFKKDWHCILTGSGPTLAEVCQAFPEVSRLTSTATCQNVVWGHFIAHSVTFSTKHENGPKKSAKKGTKRVQKGHKKANCEQPY
jgi:hypothetical protein